MQHPVLWSKPEVEQSDLPIVQFQRIVEKNLSLQFTGYSSLHQWSVDAPGEFWSLLWDFCDVTGDKIGPALVDGDDMLNAQFFPEARINFAENCLMHRGDGPAILFRSETGETFRFGWDQLAAEVSIAQQVLRKFGVSAGDRVAAVTPNIPSAVIYMLATASLGAIWSSCSPDFGAGAIIDRFAQIEPKVLLWANGYSYKGKWHDVSGTLTEVRHGLPALSACIRLQFPGSEVTSLPEGCVAEPEARDGMIAAEVEFTRVKFNDPLLILFSSGTSGRPKCIIHSTGGILLQHLKEHRLHSDLKEGDRLFFFSTCSWMMWNWLVSGLASGATITLFDGSPFWPDEKALWHMAEELRITHFGTSPKYIDTLRLSGFDARAEFLLPELRVILSTGSPLSDANFEYTYEKLHDDVLLASISGGTDIASCFLLGCPTMPVRTGELQCPGLGMDVRLIDTANAKSRIGDLVCATPFPCRPIGFWGDSSGTRFRQAYFSKYEGVWCQHDRVERTPFGGYRVLGRSDSTLNPGGVRIGTAEIYRSLDSIPEVSDAVVAGRNVDDDVEVVLFVVLKDGAELTDGLVDTIRHTIRNRCTPRHVPARVLAAPDIPRTRNGKNSEAAVKAMVNGSTVANLAQLANPECLSHFALGV